MVSSNPWVDVRLKVPPQQRPKPFSRREVKAIIQGFRDDRHYCYYADFVEFLFGTGCRTGEAIGLQWKHVADDCSSCWIGEIVSRGQRKAVKSYRPRTIPLTPYLQQMLLSRRPKPIDPNALVFPGPKGAAIVDSNFRKRAWVKVLESAGVPYRKPYISRSTLISHALDQGLNPVNLAELTGHDVDTLYKNYAGVIDRSMLPDILS
jgi:integrase